MAKPPALRQGLNSHRWPLVWFSNGTGLFFGGSGFGQWVVGNFTHDAACACCESILCNACRSRDLRTASTEDPSIVRCWLSSSSRSGSFSRPPPHSRGISFGTKATSCCRSRKESMVPTMRPPLCFSSVSKSASAKKSMHHGTQPARTADCARLLTLAPQISSLFTRYLPEKAACHLRLFDHDRNASDRCHLFAPSQSASIAVRSC